MKAGSSTIGLSIIVFESSKGNKMERSKWSTDSASLGENESNTDEWCWRTSA